jgi:hypothetical protein
MTSNKQLLDGLATDGYGGFESTVFLNFAAFGDKDGSDDTGITNRVMLKCDTLGIDTGRNVAAVPVPFSGLVTGESQTLGFDLGVANKRINLGGIITDQVIQKRFTNVTDRVSVHMTAFEVAQLMHSAVDSSFIQKHQNITELTIMIPSRVNKHYRYHSGVSESTAHPDLPLIPFTYKARKVLLDSSGNWTSTYLDPTTTGVIEKRADAFGTAATGDFPDPGDTTYGLNNNQRGVSGFIDQFSTQIVPGQPFLSFTLNFTVATVIGQ